MRFDDLPGEREGLQGGDARRSRRRSAGSSTGSARCARPAGRARDTAAARMRRRAEPDDAAPAVELPPLEGRVAIVGYPNVGKSTLVNRLTETRAAVVHETAGRDARPQGARLRVERQALPPRRHRRRRPRRSAADHASIAEQARAAIAEADLVLFVVDARAGVTPGDEEIAQILRNAKSQVILVANKVDDPRREHWMAEFHRLGLGDPFPLSALHGTGTGDLLDEVLDRLPGAGAIAEVGEEAIRVAILGRPNVGKSSLLNALVGQERVIVSDVPGTTRDAIDTVLVRGEQTFRLVDTAGLRRKRKHRQGIEYYSELRALEAAERADIALVVIDAAEGIVEQDLSVADVAMKAQCATLVVLSKWDVGTIAIEDARGELRRRMRQRPPIRAVSVDERPRDRAPPRRHRRALRPLHRPRPDRRR